LHQIASVLLKIQAVSKLGRDDEFEEPLVSGTLPIVERGCDGYVLVGAIKPCLGRPSSLCRAFAG
jgi:hypothetical protein